VLSPADCAAYLANLRRQLEAFAREAAAGDRILSTQLDARDRRRTVPRKPAPSPRVALLLFQNLPEHMGDVNTRTLEKRHDDERLTRRKTPRLQQTTRADSKANKPVLSTENLRQAAIERWP
jgi:hypothetical protein